MKLACEGCDWVTEADTAAELHAAMLAHAENTHSDLLEGKSTAEVQQMRQQMDAHVDQMIADQN
jgi:predicted small metal-binding protein